MSLKEDDFISKDIKEVDRLSNVLRKMNKGCVLSTNGYHFKLAETEDNLGFTIVMRMTSTIGDKSEYVWMGADFNHFRLCVNEMTNDNIFLLGMGEVLREVKYGDNKRG